MAPVRHCSMAQDVPVLCHAADWGEDELDALDTLARAGQDGMCESWFEYFPGSGSFVVAAPHDGCVRPEQLPKRRFGVIVRDTGTKGLAAAVAREALRRGGGVRPHLLVCHLSRSRLDVNRAREHAAEDEMALVAWDRYQALLSAACRAAAAYAPCRALFLDVHAQANYRFSGVDAVELGTFCPSGEDMGLGGAHIDQLAWSRIATASERVVAKSDNQRPANFEDSVAAALEGFFSMPRLAAAVLGKGGSLSDLLTGPEGLGSLIARRSKYSFVPSEVFPMPPPTIRVPPPRKVDLRPGGKCAPPPPSPDAEEGGEVVASVEVDDAAKSGVPIDASVPSGLSPFFQGSASQALLSMHVIIDALQAECPVRLTRQPDHWAPLAAALVGGLEDLWRSHFGRQFFRLELAPPAAAQLPAPLLSRFVYHRSCCQIGLSLLMLPLVAFSFFWRGVSRG